MPPPPTVHTRGVFDVRVSSSGVARVKRRGGNSWEVVGKCRYLDSSDTSSLPGLEGADVFWVSFHCGCGLACTFACVGSGGTVEFEVSSPGLFAGGFVCAIAVPAGPPTHGFGREVVRTTLGLPRAHFTGIGSVRPVKCTRMAAAKYLGGRLTGCLCEPPTASSGTAFSSAATLV